MSSLNASSSGHGADDDSLRCDDAAARGRSGLGAGPEQTQLDPVAPLASRFPGVVVGARISASPRRGRCLPKSSSENHDLGEKPCPARSSAWFHHRSLRFSCSVQHSPAPWNAQCHGPCLRTFWAICQLWSISHLPSSVSPSGAVKDLTGGTRTVHGSRPTGRTGQVFARGRQSSMRSPGLAGGTRPAPTPIPTVETSLSTRRNAVRARFAGIAIRGLGAYLSLCITD